MYFLTCKNLAFASLFFSFAHHLQGAEGELKLTADKLEVVPMTSETDFATLSNIPEAPTSIQLESIYEQGYQPFKKDSSIGFILLYNRRPAGQIVYQISSKSTITHFGIDPTYKNKRFDAYLLDYTLKIFNRTKTTVFVFPDTHTALYKKLGFKECATSHGLEHTPTENSEIA